MRRFALVCLGALSLCGCEVTASVYLQKDWNTAPEVFKANDLITKCELKVTRRLGADAPTPKKP